MSAKVLLVVFLGVVISTGIEAQMVGGFQQTADLNDEISQGALAKAKSALIEKGLCDAGITIVSTSRQTVRGANYKFAFKVDPSSCKVNQQWTTCDVDVNWDLKAYTVSNIVCK